MKKKLEPENEAENKIKRKELREQLKAQGQKLKQQKAWCYVSELLSVKPGEIMIGRLQLSGKKGAER